MALRNGLHARIYKFTVTSSDIGSPLEGKVTLLLFKDTSFLFDVMGCPLTLLVSKMEKMVFSIDVSTG